MTLIKAAADPPLPARHSWLHDLASSLVGVTSSLAIVLTLGLLAWAALGDAAAASGLPAAFATVTVGGLVAALGSRGTVPTAGPSSATALLLAALLGRLVSEAPAGSVPLAGLLLAAGAAVAIMGLVQLSIAWAGLAGLVHYVPRAVLAGFMNGVGLLVLLSQLPTLLGHWGVIRAEGIHPGPAALGLGTAALLWLLAWRRPQWPVSLLVLVAGVAVWAAARLWWPQLDLGPSTGTALGAWPQPTALLALADPAALALLKAHAGAVCLAGVLLGLIGSLETLLSVAAIEQTFHRRPDARRELMVMGWANVAGGLFGALPCVVVRARALAMIRAGALGRRPAFLAAAISGLLFGAGGFLLDWVPMAVLAGIMLTIGVGLLDPWSLRLLRRWAAQPRNATLLATVVTVLAVCAVTAVKGLPVGVGVGLLLSSLWVMRSLNRSLVRARFPGTERPSRRVWLPADEALLRERRSQVQLLELEGSLFFGSGQRLADEAEAVPPQCRWLLLDLRRVTTTDDSGAATLTLLAQTLQRQGVKLLLSGLSPTSGCGRELAALGLDPKDALLPWFDSADHAMEHAERELLGSEACTHEPMPLGLSTLARGLTPEQLTVLEALMPVRRLQAGEWLFREGEAARSLFVVTCGSLSAVRDQGPTRQRFSSLPAGNMVGETALLTDGGRSAGVVADGPAEVLELTQARLNEAALAQPELAAAVYRNIAAHLAQRLRAATDAWHASAG